MIQKDKLTPITRGGGTGPMKPGNQQYSMVLRPTQDVMMGQAKNSIPYVIRDFFYL